MKNQLIKIFSFLLLTAYGCKKSDSNTIRVKIKSSETYFYSTGVSGDEEGAKITKQAKNYEISEMRRNQTTNWDVVYYYKPQPKFSGKDEIEIETYTGSNGASGNKTKTIKLIIKVFE